MKNHFPIFLTRFNQLSELSKRELVNSNEINTTHQKKVRLFQVSSVSCIQMDSVSFISSKFVSKGIDHCEKETDTHSMPFLYSLDQENTSQNVQLELGIHTALMQGCGCMLL